MVCQRAGGGRKGEPITKLIEGGAKKRVESFFMAQKGLDGLFAAIAPEKRITVPEGS